jgi:hypothetical protein
MRSHLHVAVVATVGYVVIALLVGGTLLLTHTRTVEGTAQAAATSTPPTSSGPPAGYQRATGPANLVTVIPTGWPVSSIRNGFQADDPANGGAKGRFVRYQGVAGDANLLSWLTSYEHQSWSNQAGYQRLQMTQQTYHGSDAVLWEFGYSLDGQSRHVKLLYWNTSGTQYDVYASAPAADWPRTAPIFDAMVTNSSAQ